MARKTEFRQVTVRSQVLVSAACDECGSELELFPEGYNDSPITKNTLGVSAGGGYHGYIDGNASVEFCAACSKRLLELFPSISKSFDEERGF